MNAEGWIRWVARVLAALIVVLGLPFYFGYGNPLPFRNPDFTPHDNAWLCAFPLIFSGLILGWFKERLGGFLVVFAVIGAQAVTLFTMKELVPHMFVPLFVGGLYLISHYVRKRKLPARRDR